MNQVPNASSRSGSLRLPTDLRGPPNMKWYAALGCDNLEFKPEFMASVLSRFILN
jgi:hypothetical protein